MGVANNVNCVAGGSSSTSLEPVDSFETDTINLLSSGTTTCFKKSVGV